MVEAQWTLDQLLAYVGAREQLGEEWKSTKELAREFGVTLARMRGVMTLAHEHHLLERRRDVRVGYDGVGRPVQVYRFKGSHSEGIDAKGAEPD